MAKEVSTPKVDVETVSEAPDLSLFGLIGDADFFVQLIMFLLLVASVWCWTIILNKSKIIRQEKRISETFESYFKSDEVDDDALFDFYNDKKDEKNQINAQVKIFLMGMIEINQLYSKSLHTLDKGKLKDLIKRVDTVIQIQISREIQKLEKGMSFLASIGSVGPFIGLLGTVWGIVNAFQSIAISNNTSLAVVAPGIAEALFATALGLLAAIPAVAAYNKFSNDLDKIANSLEYFSIEFLSKKLTELEEKFNV